MDLYKGMRLVSFTSVSLGTTAFFVSGWILLSNRNTHTQSVYVHNGNETIDFCFQNEKTEASFNYYRESVLRSCIVVVIVSFIQVVSGVGILVSPLQGSRQRAKIWFGVNIGLNLTLFISFIVPLMKTQGQNLNLQVQGMKSEGEGGQGGQGGQPHCSWWMSSGFPLHHLDPFYVSVCLDFVVQFLVLVFSLMMLRYDENRDYELVAIV